MKFIKKHLNLVTISISLLVIIVFGVVYNIHFQKNITRRAEVAPLVQAYPTGHEFKKVERFQGLYETVEGQNVRILEAYHVFENKKLVGVVYVGKTNGFAEDMKVAYGIKYETHEIVGMTIVSSNETKSYLDALFARFDFMFQFKKKSLSADNFTVDRVSGPTPDSGDTGIIAPSTSAGLERIMKLVREQYAKDSNGKFKVPDLAQFISKRQNYDNLDEFIYVFEVDKEGTKTEVTITTNAKLQIQSVEPAEFNTDEFKQKFNVVIGINQFMSWITKIENNGDKVVLTVKTQGYLSVEDSRTLEEKMNNAFECIITLDADGDIESIVAKTEGYESYKSGYEWQESYGEPEEKVTKSIVENQNAEVDGVSKATKTSDAIKNAARVAFKYAEEVIKE